MPRIYALYVVNKSGGLIYQKDFHKTKTLTMNDHLRLASTFSSLFAIAVQLSPVEKSGGIEELDTPTFRLACFQTPTGTKFYVTAAPSNRESSSADLKAVLSDVYQLYSDYVLKSPFYELEQPIRCEQFDVRLDAKIKELR